MSAFVNGTPAYQIGGQGNVAVPFPPIQSPRSPTSTDLVNPNGSPYPVLQQWENSTTQQVYTYYGAGNWVLSQISTGTLLTLSDGSNAKASPDTTGNIQLAGTANQVTTTQGTNKITFSIPSTFTAPGSITATVGAITATNGNFVKGTAGNKDIYTSIASSATAGANSAGTVTLVGGTATVTTTAVTASSKIRLYRQGIGSTGAAALGIVTLGTITANTSFVINSVTAADATALQTSDVSSIFWEIVN